MRRTQIYVPEILWERLSVVARLEGISVSEVIRRACSKFLEAEVSQEALYTNSAAGLLLALERI